jgi:NhaP-type Na+/H+ or K+/H+ antiporter
MFEGLRSPGGGHRLLVALAILAVVIVVRLAWVLFYGLIYRPRHGQAGQVPTEVQFVSDPQGRLASESGH